MFITPEDVSKECSRAQATARGLRKINPGLKLETMPLDFIFASIESIKPRSAVCVVADFMLPYDRLTVLNKSIRDQECGFILANNFGLGGFIFVDYGDAFPQY